MRKSEEMVVFDSGEGFLYFPKRAGDGWWMVHRQGRSVSSCKGYGKYHTEEECIKALRRYAAARGWRESAEQPAMIKMRSHAKVSHNGPDTAELRAKAEKWIKDIAPHLPGHYVDIANGTQWRMATTLLRVNNCLHFGMLHVSSKPGEYPVVFSDGDGDTVMGDFDAEADRQRRRGKGR